MLHQRGGPQPLHASLPHARRGVSTCRQRPNGGAGPRNRRHLRGEGRPRHSRRPISRASAVRNGRLPDGHRPHGLPTSSTPDQFPLACMDFNRGRTSATRLMQKLGSAAARIPTSSPSGSRWAISRSCRRGHNRRGPPRRLSIGPGVGQPTRATSPAIAPSTSSTARMPVGFIRGKDINSDKAFLLKRFIE